MSHAKGEHCDVIKTWLGKGWGNALFLHCRNCDSLAVVVVAHFDPHLAGRHLAVLRKADDCFCRL